MKNTPSAALQRLRQQREKSDPNSTTLAEAKQTPAASLVKTSILTFLFYSNLGTAMPFIPVWYRSLGISGALLSQLFIHLLLSALL